MKHKYKLGQLVNVRFGDKDFTGRIIVIKARTTIKNGHQKIDEQAQLSYRIEGLMPYILEEFLCPV